MDWMAAGGGGVVEVVVVVAVVVDCMTAFVDICYGVLKSRFNTLLHMYMLYNQFFKQ